MRRLAILSAVTALAMAFGFAGSAKAQFTFPFDSDLVGYWSFDDGMDPTNDDTGGGNDADLDDTETPAFVASTAPVPGNVFALDFDGNDFATVANANVLDVTSAYTIGVWVNSDDTSLTNVYRPILVRGRNDATDGNDIEVYIQANSKDLVVAHNLILPQ